MSQLSELLRKALAEIRRVCRVGAAEREAAKAVAEVAIVAAGEKAKESAAEEVDRFVARMLGRLREAAGGKPGQ